MEKLLTVKEYADKESLSHSTIYKYIRTRKINSVIQNGKKYVVVDNSQQEIIQYNKVDIIDKVKDIQSIEFKELELLRNRVKELESYTKFFDSVVQENIKLRKENRKLTKAITFKKVKKKTVEIMEYLIGLGLTKEKREKIYKKLTKRSDEVGVTKKDGKIFINPEKYNL